MPEKLIYQELRKQKETSAKITRYENSFLRFENEYISKPPYICNAFSIINFSRFY